MTLKLEKRANYTPPKGPVVLIIMDGVGIGKYTEGDFVRAAWKPNLDWLMANCPHTTLKAHGRAVGMPTDEDMGNSEIGHNAIGCGRVYDQGASLVAKAVTSGSLFAGDLAQHDCQRQRAQLHAALHRPIFRWQRPRAH